MVLQYTGKRSYLSLKGKARDICIQQPEKWAQYMPDCPNYGGVNKWKMFKNSPAQKLMFSLKTENTDELPNGENGGWAIEDGRKVLETMLRLNDKNVNLTAEKFWTEIIFLSVSVLIYKSFCAIYTWQFFKCSNLYFQGVQKNWIDVKRHFFSTLVRNPDKYLDEHQEAQLAEKLIDADFGFEKEDNGDSDMDSEEAEYSKQVVRQ